MTILYHAIPTGKTPKRSPRRRKPTKGKTTAPRRFWLDIGKNISLALTAAKYDFDQADASGEDAQ